MGYAIKRYAIKWVDLYTNAVLVVITSVHGSACTLSVFYFRVFVLPLPASRRRVLFMLTLYIHVQKETTIC